MKNKIFIAALILAGFVLGMTSESLACKSAGPNKHIGSITAINGEAGSFTIEDAETGSLISFEATEKILKELNVKDRVMVSYKEDEGKFIAVEVHS
jgi:hypothetical protein